MSVTTQRTDHEIHSAVLQELKWDTRVDETDVGVEVDGGIVTLSGTVGSYAKKLAAEQAALRVLGVKGLANDINVHVSGSMTRTDTEIAQAVRGALEWDVMVPDENIQCTVASGWVTLSGTVSFYSEKRSAERAISNLGGVRGVINSIIVSASKVSPDSVKLSIEGALERRAVREADRIDVEVVDGTAILTGRVHNWMEKQAVVGAAASTRGVTRVEESLRVDPYF